MVCSPDKRLVSIQSTDQTTLADWKDLRPFSLCVFSARYEEHLGKPEQTPMKPVRSSSDWCFVQLLLDDFSK